MIASGRDGRPRNIQVRSNLLLDVIPAPWAIESAGGWASMFGGDSSMLPAASAAQRMIANDVSLLPLMVYRELDEVGNAVRARDTTQWQLLHQEPYPGTPAQRFWFDVAMGIIRNGNSFALKLMDAGEVVALQLLSGSVQFDERTGVYRWLRQDGTVVENIAESRVVHWRGPNFDGSRMGLSMIQLHKTTLDVGAAQETYQKAFYANNARPDIVITHPDIKSVEQGDEWVAKHEARHKGAGNHGRPMLLPANATVQTLSVSFEDAQFIQSKIHSVREVEQIFLMPPGMLHELNRPVLDADLRQRYVRQTIAPITTLIEGVLEADTDIFGVGSKLYPEFNTAALLKADIAARYAAYLQARQAGWLSPDEIRAAENYPPIPGGAGEVWQSTPVGGAPNMQPDQANTNPDDAAEDPAARMATYLAEERHRLMQERMERIELRTPETHLHLPESMRMEIPAPTVNVAPAQVRVPAPQVVVNVPEQPAPVVNVKVPRQPAPDVHVHVPEQSAPDVHVHNEAPAQLAFDVDRDPNTGLIKKIRPSE